MADRKEINIPVADPNDPYAVPAAMPSSADTNPRSFDLADFAMPTRKQEDWRFTPVERIEEFFDVFEPSGATSVDVRYIDGSAIDESVVQVRRVDIGGDLSGTVSKPNDRVSVVEWNSVRTATVVDMLREPDQPVLVQVHGNGLDLDALHLVINARDRVHGDVVVQHDGQARLAEGVEIVTGDDAHISTTFVQEWTADSKHVASHRIHVGNESSLRHSVVTLGGEVVRIRMDQDFGGEHGDLNMLGIYFVDPGEHIEHRTMVVHNHPECRSRVVYKGALSGQGAHSTFPTRRSSDLTATSCSPRAPWRIPNRTSKSRTATSWAPGMRARSAGSTTRSCSTCARAASPNGRRANSWCVASSANSSKRSASSRSPAT